MKTYDLTEAAELLKCNPETVREIVAAGEIIAARVGVAYVIMEEDLVDYLRRQARAQTQARRARAEGEAALEGRGTVTPIRQTRAQRRGRRITPPELPDLPNLPGRAT